jgi:hypothetical protein
MKKVEELGIVKGTPQYNGATRVFKSSYNRMMFLDCDSPDQMRDYLQGFFPL